MNCPVWSPFWQSNFVAFRFGQTVVTSYLDFHGQLVTPVLRNGSRGESISVESGIVVQDRSDVSVGRHRLKEVWLQS